MDMHRTIESVFTGLDTYLEVRTSLQTNKGFSACCLGLVAVHAGGLILPE
jgi:hypothetical protein